MQQIPREQILRRHQALPPALQEAIFSQKTADAILKHCALRDVPPQAAYIIGTLSSRVLLGYLRPENFAQEIQKETGVDAEKAAQVAHDLDTEIFSAVRLELKKLYPPTIQTPTVQSPGFSRQESGMKNQELRIGIQDQKPRYVVQIPEKFLKQESGIRNKELGIMEKTAQAPAPPPPAQPVAPPATPKQPAPIIKATPATTPPEPSPAIKPVVPLPTFIHTKFQNKNKE